MQEDQEMLQAFSQMQNKNDMAEVLKELFDEGKIYMIGDMSKDEIRLATRIYMIAKMKKLELWQEGLLFYMKMKMSQDRKSRREIIEAISGYSKPRNLFQRMNPANWGRG